MAQRRVAAISIKRSMTTESLAVIIPLRTILNFWYNCVLLYSLPLQKEKLDLHIIIPWTVQGQTRDFSWGLCFWS